LKEIVIDHNIDTSKSRDIKMENFDITYGKDTLLLNATVTLAFGRRYGLIGRNGTGKSSLLRAIAERQIAGIPGHVRILHVEQEVEGDDKSALEWVLECDRERTVLLIEEKKLMKEDPTSPRLKKIYDRLQEIDAYSAESRAGVILFGLGFTEDMQKRPSKEYSGGWRMRIALARALFAKPDLLLLDEPTNHLDLFSCLWLEEYLNNWKGTILVVSHQREFLNGICTDVLHLNQKKVDYYKGNYDSFESTRYERMLQQQRQFEAQQKQIKHVQGFVDRFRFNAKRASLVQSRLKMLERMQVVEEVLQDPTLTIQFPDPDSLSPPVLQFQDVTFGYSKENVLFKELNIGIDLESRVALVGPNGCGKSTLMNLLSGGLNPIDGRVLRNGKLKFAQFTQHFVDTLDLEISPLEHFMQTFPGVSIQSSRAHLGSFGLSGDIVLRTINTLSGGQKSRLVFSVLAYRNPHVLLMDEPTNHLDVETIDSLCQALLAFKGGVLIVSHDERLISVVCETIWYLNDQRVTIFTGEYAEYKKMLLEKVKSTFKF